MKIISDIIYSPETGMKLDIYLPNTESFPVFVFFHGGGLSMGTKQDCKENFEYLCSKGVCVVSCDYRMLPEYNYPAFIEDAATGVAWVKNNIHLYGNAEKIFVGGSSAGGYLSMMLCFDSKYLGKYGIDPSLLGGFFHDAGQPTVHYAVLNSKGLDTRRVIVDESSAIYHIGTAKEYAPMIFIVSDNDMPGRYNQTLLALDVLKNFGYDQSKIKLKVMHGTHTEYLPQLDENGESVYGKMILEFINEYR